MVSSTCVSNLIVINNTINQIETNVRISLNKNVLPEAICCYLQTCKNVASDLMGGTCVPSLIVIGTTIKQLETKQFIA